MASGGAGTTSSPQVIPRASHRGAPTPVNTSSVVSPPSKKELASWWRKFRKTTEKPEEKDVDVAPGIFGVPLAESIRYANVAISLTNEQGESFIYGYVPIVVAKCGVFLKEKATDVEGIFRLSGSAKRIKDLQTIFNSPDRYGKGLDWTGYTVHDAANILRRYLNQLPEPIVPLESYERFRDPLRPHQVRSMNDSDAHNMDLNVEQHAVAVSSYQKLITELPPLNRQLLLYILDLLAVFASKSDLNRMTAANLAAIFQPGIISHPQHDMAPVEYRLSQEVLIFLIENQDNFLIGMTGTAVDEKTQKDVESGAPSIRSPKSNIGRSASNASGGADSLRKYGARRNVSVSSRASRERGSPGVSTPGTPSGVTPYASGSTTTGVARSNTVPSKRSPAISSNRFQRVTDSSGSNSPAISSTAPGPETLEANQEESASATVAQSPVLEASQAGATAENTVPQTVSHQSMPVQPAVISQDTFPMPTSADTTTNVQAGGQERKISTLFSKSPIFGPSDPQQRQPKKLQKKRIPGTANDSAQSSTNSLQGDESGAHHTPLRSPELVTSPKADPMTMTRPEITNTVTTPRSEIPNQAQYTTSPDAQDRQGVTSTLKPHKSPEPSLHSRSSMTDHSEFEALEDSAAKPEKAEKRRHRWRLSSAAKKNDDYPLIPPPPIGQNPNARGSNSSIGSSNRARKSFTVESRPSQPPMAQDHSNMGQSTLPGQTNQDMSDAQRDSNVESEKKGLFGKWKARMSQTREEKRERDAEKERAKSPPRAGAEQGMSRNSLTAFAQEHFAPRGRSFDRQREESMTSTTPKPNFEAQSPNSPINPQNEQSPNGKTGP